MAKALLKYPGRMEYIYEDTPSVLFDEADENTIYVAYEKTTDETHIKKMEKTGTETESSWAWGTWANKAVLTYADIQTYKESL